MMTEPDHVPVKCKQLAPVVKAACTGAGAATVPSSEPDPCNSRFLSISKTLRLGPTPLNTGKRQLLLTEASFKLQSVSI